MNGAYASGGQAEPKSVGVVIGIVSVLAAVLVIAGLFYATGIGERRKVLLAAGGCAPSLSHTGLDCTTEQHLASQYAKMATPAVQQLNTDAAAYAASESGNLAAAEAALRAEVTVEKAFGANLAQFPFPSAIVPAAQKLIKADDVLAKLTAEQARSGSVTQMQSFNVRVEAAAAIVQADVTIVGKALARPPTPSEEP